MDTPFILDKSEPKQIYNNTVFAKITSRKAVNK